MGFLEGDVQVLGSDHDRAFSSLLTLVEETGKAQHADLVSAAGGKKIKDQNWWRIAPENEKDRSPGTTIYIYTPDGRSFRQLIPRNRCTATTVRLLEQSLDRFGFDTAEARKTLNARARELAAQQQQAAAERERLLHQNQATGRSTVQQVRKKKKVHPTERVDSADINASYAQAMLDERGDGSIIPRPLSDANLRRFVDLIDSEPDDLWVPDYLYVDWFGFVVNGRHRLTAITMANRKSVPCKFVLGVDPMLYNICDSAKTRSGGDALFSSGLSPEGGRSHLHMASALRMLHCYKIGAPWGSWGKTRVESSVFVELAHRYPLITEAMERAKVLRPGRLVGRASYTPSAAVVFCYLAVERLPDHGDLLDQFMLAVTLGENLSGGDPRKALYNLMTDKQGSRRSPEANLSSVRQLALLLKMWNQWLSGKQVGVATWREGEQMPLAITENDVVLPG